MPSRGFVGRCLVTLWRNRSLLSTTIMTASYLGNFHWSCVQVKFSHGHLQAQLYESPLRVRLRQSETYLLLSALSVSASRRLSPARILALLPGSPPLYRQSFTLSICMSSRRSPVVHPPLAKTYTLD